MKTRIEIIGARTHNLKNVSCGFDHGTLNVITGVSGSGKSSLAFDTLYAEGQRRYVESMSTYARQFLERMERPDMDSITGIQPAIALEQKNGVRSARSTVGTATEIHDFLRLLFAKLGTTWCPVCEKPVQSETAESAVKMLENLEEGTRVIVLGPTKMTGANLTESVRLEMIRSGHFRLWDGARIIDIEAGEKPDDPKKPLAILVDRVAMNPESRTRLHQAMQMAFLAGKGRADVQVYGTDTLHHFFTDLTCNGCGQSFTQPTPPMFSFYSPLGACPKCEGFGRVMELDLDKVIPNRDLSITDGAIAPWNSTGNLEMYDKMIEKTRGVEVPRNKAIKDFTPEQWDNLVNGVGKFKGIRGFFDYLEKKKYRVQSRVMLARYRAYRPCPTCKGRRLIPEVLNVRLGDKNIYELTQMPVRDLIPFMRSVPLNDRQRETAERIFDGMMGRLDYLDQIGLGYLTLDRTTRTLSGGEAQRINLATSLGAGLTQTLYVLDEPTVGLHSRDTDRLIGVLRSLRDLGNTVVVVEHDLEVIRQADKVLDMGPGAGELGGQILFDGTLEKLTECDSPTSHHIRTYNDPPVPSHNRKPNLWIEVKGARGNNLCNINVRVPLGVFCCITGVSGSGKTTLIRDTLAAAYRRKREVAPIEVCPYRSITGMENIKELHWVDQTPLSRSSRSNPATYVKAFDAIRKTLASTREARAAGIEARHFSFNVDAGRCPACKGTGVQLIDMHFMADISVVCDECDGKRFRTHVLQFRWRGKNIDDILNMTVDEATAFFHDEPKAARALKPLRDVGLGYLRLGQNTTTLSGGEAQRLKLAGHLSRMRDGEGLVYLFDEPTTGLHAADLVKLLGVFHELVRRGCSLIVIEHNLDLIASADYIIDMGPDGGDLGGKVVARGTPEKIMATRGSLTGKYMKERFGKSIEMSVEDV